MGVTFMLYVSVLRRPGGGRFSLLALRDLSAAPVVQGGVSGEHKQHCVHVFLGVCDTTDSGSDKVRLRHSYWLDVLRAPVHRDLATVCCCEQHIVKSRESSATTARAL